MAIGGIMDEAVEKIGSACPGDSGFGQGFVDRDYWYVRDLFGHWYREVEELYGVRKVCVVIVLY